MSPPAGRRPQGRGSRQASNAQCWARLPSLEKGGRVFRRPPESRVQKGSRRARKRAVRGAVPASCRNERLLRPRSDSLGSAPRGAGQLASTSSSACTGRRSGCISEQARRRFPAYSASCRHGCKRPAGRARCGPIPRPPAGRAWQPPWKGIAAGEERAVPGGVSETDQRPWSRPGGGPRRARKVP